MSVAVNRMMAAIVLGLVAIAGPTLQATDLRRLLENSPGPQERIYKRGSNSQLKLYYFTPDGWKPSDRRPAIIWIHGGAWVAGGAETFFPHARYFATRGAVGFSLEYRLMTPGGTTVADCLSDCKSAVRYVRAHASELGVDPARIAVAGDSAGGHLAAALGTIDGFDDPADDRSVSAVPNAMILCNAIFDFKQDGFIKSIIGGAALDKHPAPAATQPSARQLELADRLSPLYAVRPHQPPALVMHGLDDHVVSPEQSRQFTAAMEKSGNRCDLILLEGSRHAFIVPKYTASEPVVVNALRAADSFLISLGYLGGDPTLEASDPPAWVIKPKSK